MSVQITLTDRDEELLKALVMHVRLFALRQVADHWWNGELANTRRRLRQLMSVGLLISAQVQARPIHRLTGPIFEWKPGHQAPDFGPLAHQLQTRIRRIPVRSINAFMATDRAAKLVGGVSRGELKHPGQATHDLGVAAVWLHLSRHEPQRAAMWVGEDLMARHCIGDKRPDAFLCDASGAITGVVEFGGDYDRSRIEGFHEHCASHRLPYQLW